MQHYRKKKTERSSNKEHEKLTDDPYEDLYNVGKVLHRYKFNAKGSKPWSDNKKRRSKDRKIARNLVNSAYGKLDLEEQE